ncbi:MAG: murein biosynthesis integral membrane protein MurJ [Cellvibrionales bacterium TMED49]|nr:MAG: murein biosynthesis integral membrane protein MurJ [Cellvibrionales bacterium TMED49]
MSIITSSGAGQLFRATRIVSIFTMLSRILGLIRDMVLARVIGADMLADVFFVAFKIPNFFRRLFAEGAFAQAFVPVLGEYREHGTHVAVRELVSRVTGTLGLTLTFVTLMVVSFAPFFAALFAPSWYFNSPEKFEATASMLRVTFPYLMFISLTGVAGAILNSYDRFAVPSFTPILLNVSMIFAAIFATSWFDRPAFALAWGVLIAGLIQFAFQLPFLRRIHMLPAPVIDWHHPGVIKILTLMGPAIFGVSVSQINLLLDTILATFLPTGSVSWLYYSDRIAELPLGVFGVAIATVILPSLSRNYASKSSVLFSATLDWAITLVLLVAMPATIALVILAEPILMTLFYYGDVMTLLDMEMATLSMRAYASGLIAFMLIKILAPGFFARQDMRTPVRIGIIAMVANMAFNLIFLSALHFYWQIGHVGLALATSLSAYINAGLLYLELKKQGIYLSVGEVGRFIKPLAIALTFMTVILIFMTVYFGVYNAVGWEKIDGLSRFLRLIVICGVACAGYLAALRAFGVRYADLLGPRMESYPNV